MEEKNSFEIKWEPPSWQLLGDLAIDELKEGHTQYALGIIPMMVEKLVLLERYRDKEGRIHITPPEC